MKSDELENIVKEMKKEKVYKIYYPVKKETIIIRRSITKAIKLLESLLNE